MSKADNVIMYCPNCAKEKLTLVRFLSVQCPNCKSWLRVTEPPERMVIVMNNDNVVIGRIDPKSHWLTLLTPKSKRTA